MMFFSCAVENCRNHFQVLRTEGQKPKIVAESPHKVPKPVLADAKMGNMGCPQCTRYGKVTTTVNRRDGYWRRHQCVTCGPYYTCEKEDGVSVHQRLKSIKARDINAA
jgi:hypothetical protein